MNNHIYSTLFKMEREPDRSSKKRAKKEIKNTDTQKKDM